jgi:hypothetical protein
MSVARHPRSKELEGVPVEEIMKKYVGRYSEKRGDWAAFEDAKIEGFKRSQHRFIGAGGSGKHGDTTVIPAGNFTLSIMYVPVGQGNAAHTHEVEECFFVLQGQPDIIKAFHQAPAGVIIDLERSDNRPAGYGARLKVDRDFGSRVVLDFFPNQLDITLGDLCGYKALLTRIPTENICEARGKNRLEPIVFQCPDSVFARGPGTEVRAGHQHGTG